MCGRINVSDNEGVRLLLAMLGMEVWPSREPRFNVAPTQSLDVVQWQNELILTPMRWGLTPTWAKPGQFSAPLINARSETIRQKPSFRKLIADRRVVIPINGFYEWHREGKAKRPLYIDAANHPALLLAGIFQEPKPTESSTEQNIGQPAVCVVTTAANETMQPIHHRMPLILSPADALTWIQESDTALIDSLMRPASNDALRIKQVGSYVNSTRNQGPQCLEPDVIDDLFSN